MSNKFFNNRRINELITQQLDNIFTAYGDIKYAYAIVNKRDPLNMRIINNQPAWVEVYLENSYQLIDPVIIKALGCVEDFPWDEKIMIAAEVTLPRIFNAGKPHNIKTGHTFVLHDHKNNLAVLSIMEGDLGEQGLKAFIRNHHDYLQALLIATHQKMITLYREIEGMDQPKTAMLSARENEVIYWSSLGKTYQEIAFILEITQSTVKFHMGNIVKKLGVANAKHAIKLAVELQIIQPIDSSLE